MASAPYETPCPVQGLVCPTTGPTSVVTRALIVYRKSQPTSNPFPATCLLGPLSHAHLVHLSHTMHVRAAAVVVEKVQRRTFSEGHSIKLMSLCMHVPPYCRGPRNGSRFLDPTSNSWVHTHTTCVAHPHKRRRTFDRRGPRTEILPP